MHVLRDDQSIFLNFPARMWSNIRDAAWFRLVGQRDGSVKVSMKRAVIKLEISVGRLGRLTTAQ